MSRVGRGGERIPTRSLSKSTRWELSSVAFLPASTKAPNRYFFAESIPGVDERSIVSSLPEERPAACQLSELGGAGCGWNKTIIRSSGVPATRVGPPSHTVCSPIESSIRK